MGLFRWRHSGKRSGPRSGEVGPGREVMRVEADVDLLITLPEDLAASVAGVTEAASDEMS
jgi:hypothetical protein